MSDIVETSRQMRAFTAGGFETTQWTVILAAGRESDESRETAFAELCEKYWYPLYSYVRRQGSSHADAQDLTQGFFLHLLSNGAVGGANPQRGRFRTFLLHALKNFMISEHRKAFAGKRGGGASFVSLDDRGWDERFRAEPTHDENPERIYHRNWANALLEHALKKLEMEQACLGKAAQFEFLKDYVAGGEEVPNGMFGGNALGMSPGALSQALYRIRGRFGEILREQVETTVTSAAEIDDELRALLAAL